MSEAARRYARKSLLTECRAAARRVMHQHSQLVLLLKPLSVMSLTVAGVALGRNLGVFTCCWAGGGGSCDGGCGGGGAISLTSGLLAVQAGATLWFAWSAQRFSDAKLLDAVMQQQIEAICEQELVDPYGVLRSST